MQYRRLGEAGIKLSALSYGSWLTFGNQLDVSAARQLILAAAEAGVNFFDNAEAYAGGESERVMGNALRDLRREDLVVSSKIFWGGNGPNDRGLSKKHLIEGCNNALKRLQLDYLDLLFCHRPDPETPIEETVRAMDILIRQGKVLYWGTSEWSADQLEKAYQIAYEIHATPPTMEQPQYNLFHFDRVEREYAPLYQRYGLGTTTWSPLASGILSGKYSQGIPAGSRLANVKWLSQELTPARIAAVREFTQVANDLGATPSQLAIAWCLQNPNVSSVILGATRLEQLKENLHAASFVDKLTPEVNNKLREIQQHAQQS